jgi:hypothetical protein
LSDFLPRDQFARGPRSLRSDTEIEADYAAQAARRQGNIRKYGGAELSNEEFAFLNDFERNPERYRLNLAEEDFALFNQVFPGEQTNEEYEANRYRVATAVQLSRMYQISFKDAYTHEDDILEAAYDERVRRDPKTAFKAVSDSFALGTNQKRLAALGMRLWGNADTEERNRLWREAEAIARENEELADGVQRGWFLEGLKGVGTSWAFSASAAGAGFLGGLINPVLGVVSAAAISSWDMTGLEYINLLSQGIDDDTARRVALISGSIQGMIEAALGSVPALGTRTGIGQMIFKRLHYSGKFGAIARFLGGGLIDAGMEGVEEALQEVTGIGFLEEARRETEATARRQIAGERAAAEGDYAARQAAARRIERAPDDSEIAAYLESVRRGYSGMLDVSGRLMGGGVAGMEGLQGALNEVSGTRAPDREAPRVERAAEDLATAAYREYLAALRQPGNEGLRLARQSAEENRAQIWEAFKGGFLTGLVLGVPIFIRDAAISRSDTMRLREVQLIAPDAGTIKKEMDTMRSFEPMTDKTKTEIAGDLYSANQQEQQREEDALTAANERARLYGGASAAQGEVYRRDGSLYAEHHRERNARGVTRGEFIAGDPGGLAENSYGAISYELHGGRIEIGRVRMAAGREGLQEELLQDFADDLGQDITWDETTYRPSGKAFSAAHIGWEAAAKRQAGTPQGAATAEPNTGKKAQTRDEIIAARVAEGKTLPRWWDPPVSPAIETLAETALLPDLDGAERALDEGLARAMPNIPALERRANIELVKLHADYHNLSLEEYLNRNFQEGVFTGQDAGQIAADQNHGAPVNGATVFDPANGKALIAGSTWADASTAAHEFLHVFSRTLEGDDLAQYRQLFQNDEEAARSYEKYLETGEAPTETLKGLFEKIKAFMRRIYELVKNGHTLTDEQKAFWDGIFRTAETNRENNIEALRRAVADESAPRAARADAAAELAGVLYAEALVPEGDRGHSPTAALIARALRIPDAAERGRVTAEIRALRDRYAGTAAEYRAPNGEPSLLLAKLGEEKGREAWYAVRTSDFKKWFGDWERAARIEKLYTAGDITLDGNAYAGKYEIGKSPKENRNSIINYLKTLLENEKLENPDVPGPIKLGNNGIDKITSYGMSNPAYMKTIAHIPALLKNAVLIAEEAPRRADPHYYAFKHLVTGFEMEGEKYTAHIVLGENAGVWYYQHNLSQIEKGTLIEVIRGTNSGLQGSLSNTVKDSTLLEILQAPGISKVVDANGEPLPVYRGDKDGLDRFMNAQGVFHASDSSVAGGYSSGGLYKNYLDIKNPLVLDEHSFNEIREAINDMTMDIFEQDESELENNRQFQDLRKNYLAFRNEEGSAIRDFYNDFLPEVSENTSLEEFKEILLKSLHDTNTFEWRQIDFRDIDILNPFIQALGYDGIIRPYDPLGQAEGREFVTFSPNQIKSATDNAGTFSRENPSILFQDEDLGAFLSQNPWLVTYAAAFDTWQEFKEMIHNSWFDEERAALALVPEGADDAWYRSLWESAKAIAGRDTAETLSIRGAEPRTVEDFLDFVVSGNGVEELYRLKAEAEDSGFRPDTPEEQEAREAALRAAAKLSHPSWNMRDRNGRIPEEVKRNLVTQIRNRPVAYMELYALLSGDASWMPEETEAARIGRLDRGREDEIARASPEELSRIRREINYEAIGEKIENRTLQIDDPGIADYEAELNERKRQTQARLDKKKADLSDYQRILDYNNQMLAKEKLLAREAERDTSPQGLTANRKQQAKIRKLEGEIQRLRIQYGAFLKNLNTAERQHIKEVETLIRELQETAQALRAIQDWREIRKREVRAVTRKPNLNTTHIEQAHQIQWIQGHFKNLYRSISKFLGPRAKKLRELYAAFTTDQEYREKFRREHPVEFRQAEEIVYTASAYKGAGGPNRTVRAYTELTAVQRNRLYNLLLDDKTILDELGIDSLEPPQPFSPEEDRRIAESLRDVIPADILYKMENSDINEWTMEDLETLGGIISDIRQQGRDALAARNDARRVMRISNQSKINALLRGKLKRAESRVRGTAEDSAEEKRRAWLPNLFYSLMNGRRFFRMLGGDENSLVYRLAVEGEDRAYREENTRMLERRKTVEEQLAKEGIKPNELWKHTFILDTPGFKRTSFTLDELLYLRRAGFNERAYAAVVFGNFLDAEERRVMKAASINEENAPAWRPDPALALEIEERALKRYGAAMSLLDEFLAKPENAKFRAVEGIIAADYDANYERLREFTAREFNAELGSELYYVPLGRLQAIGEDLEQQSINEILNATGFGMTPEKGFTLHRIDIGPWHQTPVRLGLYKTWDGMVVKQEHLMAYGPYLREMRQIFEGQGSGALREAMQLKYTNAATDYVRKWISDLASPQNALEYSALDEITRLVRGHYPAAVLSWRLSSIIKQAVTSPPPFLQYMGPHRYLAALAEFISNPETRELIAQKSVFMKTRMYDPSIEMVKRLEQMYLPGVTGKIESALASVEKAGMHGLELIDYWTVAPGWLAAYRQKLEELSTKGPAMTAELADAEAVLYADGVVRDTQPSSRTADLPPLFRGKKGPVAQMFLQFQVPMAVIFQNLAFDLPYAVRRHNIWQALMTVGAYAMAAAVVGAMEEEEDDEKLNPAYRGIDAGAGLLESIPVLGGGLAYSARDLGRRLSEGKTARIKQSRFTPYPIPASLTRAANAAFNEKWEEARINAAEAFFYATGLPAGLGKEILTAKEEGNFWIFLGIK